MTSPSLSLSLSLYLLQCRLIISQMSDQPCQLWNPLFLPPFLSLSLSFLAAYYPEMERKILYSFCFISLTAHLHYGISVVRTTGKYRTTKNFREKKLLRISQTFRVFFAKFSVALVDQSRMLALLLRNFSRNAAA